MTLASDRVSRPDDVEARVFGACLVLLAVHAVDVALAHPVAPGGARIGFVLASLVLAPVLWWDFVAHGRLIRTLLAGVLGLAALAMTLAVDVPHVVLSGPAGADYTGLLFALGAVVLIALPTLLIASNRRGERTIDAAYRQRIRARATLWFVRDAGHTLALQQHPQAYAARVMAFLANALRTEPSTAVDEAR